MPLTDCSHGSKALSLASLTVAGLFFFNRHFQTLKMDHIQTVLAGVVGAVTAATSLSATYIICRKIMASGGGNTTKERYQRIIRMLIESSMLYSITGVIYAIPIILLAFPKTGNVPGAMVDYVTCISAAMTVGSVFLFIIQRIELEMQGIAPTLMVAQISASSAPCSSGGVATNNRSSLRFQQQGGTDVASNCTVEYRLSLGLDLVDEEEKSSA